VRNIQEEREKWQASKEKREQDIAEALKLYYKDVCLVGETLSSDQRVYCMKVVRQVSRSKPNAQSYSFILSEENHRTKDEIATRMSL